MMDGVEQSERPFAVVCCASLGSLLELGRFGEARFTTAGILSTLTRLSYSHHLLSHENAEYSGKSFTRVICTIHEEHIQ
jgi:hypothetical protein